jgi:hypothetical protein
MSTAITVSCVLTMLYSFSRFKLNPKLDSILRANSFIYLSLMYMSSCISDDIHINCTNLPIGFRTEYSCVYMFVDFYVQVFECAVYMDITIPNKKFLTCVVYSDSKQKVFNLRRVFRGAL